MTPMFTASNKWGVTDFTACNPESCLCSNHELFVTVLLYFRDSPFGIYPQIHWKKWLEIGVFTGILQAQMLAKLNPLYRTMYCYKPLLYILHCNPRPSKVSVTTSNAIWEEEARNPIHILAPRVSWCDHSYLRYCSMSNSQLILWTSPIIGVRNREDCLIQYAYYIIFLWEVIT